MGLSEIGVQLDSNGYVVCGGDDQTTVPGIFAIGDVIQVYCKDKTMYSVLIKPIEMSSYRESSYSFVNFLTSNFQERIG